MHFSTELVQHVIIVFAASFVFFLSLFHVADVFKIEPDTACGQLSRSSSSSLLFEEREDDDLDEEEEDDFGAQKADNHFGVSIRPEDFVSQASRDKRGQRSVEEMDRLLQFRPEKSLQAPKSTGSYGYLCEIEDGILSDDILRTKTAPVQMESLTLGSPALTLERVKIALHLEQLRAESCSTSESHGVSSLSSTVKTEDWRQRKDTSSTKISETSSTKISSGTRFLAHNLSSSDLRSSDGFARKKAKATEPKHRQRPTAQTVDIHQKWSNFTRSHYPKHSKAFRETFFSDSVLHFSCNHG
jgi:hypothetical protein